MVFNRTAKIRRTPLVAALLLAAVCLSARTSIAAPKYGNSLDWVPADAVFYSASMRLKEQWDIVAKSNAWNKLKNMPSVQMGWQLAQISMGQFGVREHINQFLADPQNQELADLAVDAISHEIMMYGDKSSADFLDVALRTVNAIQYGSMVADLHGERDENVSARIILNSLNDQRDRISAPGITMGFKLTDVKRAQNQLKRLEQHAKDAQNAQNFPPQLRGKLKRSTIAGSEYLTLELDGAMAPWDQIPWKDLEEKPGQYDALKAKLAGLKLVVSLGLRGDYLLLNVGSSTTTLAGLGTGKLLADEPEFKPLAKFADKKLVEVAFVSKAMLRAVSDTNRELDQAVQIVKQMLPEADLPEDVNKRIIKDTEELIGELKGVVSEPGSQMSFSFLTPQGVEGYSHDWTVNNLVDASKPLTILEHVGGNPLLAVAGRSKYSPQQYDTMRKWVIKGFGYFEDLAVPQMDTEDQVQYKTFKEAAMPLVARFDKATGQMLLPALADGQAAFVLDAKLTSTQWFEGLPQGKRPMPMLEGALVFGVSDAELLKKACAEYRAIASDAVEIARKLHPEELPADFKLPQPESRETKAGLISWYKLPPDAGVDEQLVPNTGLNKTTAVMSFAPKTTERLLEVAPLTVTTNGPLANTKRPLAGALVFNWAGLLDAATPWIDLIVREAAAQGMQGAGAGFFLAENNALANLAAADDNPATKMILDQVHTVIDVLKAFRTVEAATYIEDGVTVTHSLCVFQDLP
jgi:hypothetical protein